MIAINTKHMLNNTYCDRNIYCTNIARCSNIKYFLPRERFWICARIGSNPIIVKTKLTLYNMIDITAIFLHKWNSVFVLQYFPPKKKSNHFPLLSLSPSYLFIKSNGRLLIWNSNIYNFLQAKNIVLYIFMYRYIKYEIY